MSNVPAPTFGPNGFVAPDEGAVLVGVKADINAAFDNLLNMADETPQGQLSVSLAALNGFKNDLFLWFTNQVDPAYASGRMQDAIGRIYFIERKPAVPTVVMATLTGRTGAVIPAGSLAQATDGNIYSSSEAVTIPASGTVDVSFTCATNGPIACPAGTLTRVFRAVSGWDNVTNAADGIVGVDVEGREAFEQRRVATVALNALGTLPALVGSVLAVNGVVDAYVTENDSGAAVVVGDVTLAPHSIYVAAYGGTDDDVAQAIWRKKTGGAAYNGNTTVVVEDRSSGYIPPYPAYQVKFQRPTPAPVKFAVDLALSPAVPADAAAQVQAAIVRVFNGVDNNERERIGGTLFASRYYCAVAALGPWARVRSIHVGTTTATLDSVSFGIDEIPTLNPADIVVTTS